MLVRNLLDMSRIEAGELRPSLEALDVEGLITPVVERVTRTLGQPPVQIAFGPDLPPIRADASLFDEMLANLLENAARYAPDAVTRVSANSGADGRVRIRVEDAGPGVPAASLPRLFDKFYRVPRQGEGARRGLGIGLGVVKGLAEAMGGEVARAPARWAAWPSTSSSTRRRSRRASSSRTRPRDRERATAPRGPRILLVEDDGSTRSLIASNLEAHGYQVREAGTAADAVRAWDAQRPDLVVLDLGLPDTDGTTVIRRVRRDGTTPILILSARDDEPDKVAALELGADDYVTKPFGLEELRARVAALLRRAAGPAADTTGTITLGHARRWT